jgi:uncharacterized membrane protein YkvA (DUF1232 family)
MWLNAGGTRVGDGFFLLTPSTQKPLKNIPLTHRSRTRRKRLLQDELQDALLLSVRKTFRWIEPSQGELPMASIAGHIVRTNSQELDCQSGRGHWQNIGAWCRLEFRTFSSIFAPRGPILPKLVFAAGLVYLFVPLDIIPDEKPYVGHLDEIFSVMSGLVGSRLLVSSKERMSTRGNTRVP